MNPKGKKFISLLLAFSLMLLPVSLYADRKEGVRVLITEKDGTTIEGELIAVKEDSLLILTRWAKWDRTIKVVDIDVILIVGKSEALLYSVTGLLVGGIVGVAYGIKKAKAQAEPAPFYLVQAGYGFIFGLIGFAIGMIGGTAMGVDETIQIDGLSERGLEETLKYLRTKARISNYE